jgi:hypothetical protein
LESKISQNFHETQSSFELLSIQLIAESLHDLKYHQQQNSLNGLVRPINDLVFAFFVSVCSLFSFNLSLFPDPDLLWFTDFLKNYNKHNSNGCQTAKTDGRESKRERGKPGDQRREESGDGLEKEGD